MKVLLTICIILQTTSFLYLQENNYEVISGYTFEKVIGPVNNRVSFKNGNSIGVVSLKSSVKGPVNFDGYFEDISEPCSSCLFYKRSSNYGLISFSGNIITKSKYEQLNCKINSQLINAKKNGNWGFINNTGKAIIPFRYEEVDFFFEEQAAAKFNGVWGFVDKQDYFRSTYKSYTNLRSYSNGLAAAKVNQKWGFIDQSENTIIPFKFSEALSFKANGLAEVKLNGKWGVIDKSNQSLIPFKYEEIRIFKSNYIFVKLNGKWGLVDRKHQAIVDFKFDDIGGLENDLATVNVDNAWKLIRIGQDSREEVKKIVVQKKEVSTSENILVWLNPDPDINNKTTLENPLPISLRIIGDSFKKENLVIFRNDEKVENKMGEMSLKASSFSAQVPLVKGLNEIYVRLNDNNSKKIKVFYSPDKPNLHLLTIGPDYSKSNDISSLKYTQNDALKVAEKFNTQEGGIYSKVYKHEIMGLNADATSITSTINLLDEDQISPNDVLIVYVSSHGGMHDFLGKPSFFLHGSDFQNTSIITTSVLFESISSKLMKINCKKLLFIDACHSGGAKGGESEAINETIDNLIQSQNGTVIFSSSSAEEYSYELDKYKHGAFTKVLLDALDGDADSNQDRKINIGELSSYLSIEVKKLVKNEKGKSQNPQFASKGLDLDLPIFVY